MPLESLSSWICTCLLVGLRIVPVFAFAPPFNLIPVPRLVKVLFGLGLAVSLAATLPVSSVPIHPSLVTLVVPALRELMLGIAVVLIFQLAFAALYVAGRTIDVQAGYGLSLVINPASQTQSPLVGTLFAYAAGAIFFALDGHVELLRFLAASLDVVPLGQWSMPVSLDHLTAFLSVSFLIAFGVAGASMLCLFLADISIALLSRTVPQMNVLILGFQVKTILLFLVLPTSFSVGGALLIRLMTSILQALPGML
jgi:flagellar biosynthetic protein FliR